MGSQPVPVMMGSQRSASGPIEAHYQRRQALYGLVTEQLRADGYDALADRLAVIVGAGVAGGGRGSRELQELVGLAKRANDGLISGHRPVVERARMFHERLKRPRFSETRPSQLAGDGFRWPHRTIQPLHRVLPGGKMSSVMDECANDTTTTSGSSSSAETPWWLDACAPEVVAGSNRSGSGDMCAQQKPLDHIMSAFHSVSGDHLVPPTWRVGLAEGWFPRPQSAAATAAAAAAASPGGGRPAKVVRPPPTLGSFHAVFSPDGRFVAVGHEHGAHVQYVASLRDLRDGMTGSGSTAVSSDVNDEILYASADALSPNDLSKQAARLRLEFSLPSSCSGWRARALAYNPKRPMLSVVTADGMVRLFQISRERVDVRSVYDCANERLVKIPPSTSGTGTGTGAAAAAATERLEYRPPLIRTAAFHSDGRCLWVGNDQGQLRLLDVEQETAMSTYIRKGELGWTDAVGSALPVIPGYGAPDAAAAASPGGASHGGRAGGSAGAMVNTTGLTSKRSPLVGLCVDQFGGQWVAGVHARSTVVLYDARVAQEACYIQQSTRSGSASCIQSSRCGQYLLVSGMMHRNSGTSNLGEVGVLYDIRGTAVWSTARSGHQRGQGGVSGAVATYCAPKAGIAGGRCQFSFDEGSVLGMVSDGGLLEWPVQGGEAVVPKRVASGLYAFAVSPTKNAFASVSRQLVEGDDQKGASRPVLEYWES